MKNGLARFEFYLLQLEDLMLKASKENNAGLFLYTNDARTVLFMLEGLSKLYAGMHNKKIFFRIQAAFKSLEDAIGAIDYYDGYARGFLNDATIPAAVSDYLHAQTREKIQKLNELLTEKKWTGENANRIKKIRKKLIAADWKQEEKEVKAIARFYEKSIKEITVFVKKTDYTFTEIETQVHDLRRKLRWLSIYPRALQGVIQLTENHIQDDYLKKYMTAEIFNSPYNQMPETGNNQYLLLFEKDYFLALSWMISSLGKRKDSGLKIVAITEALQQAWGVDHNTALAKTYEILGPTHPGLSTILSDSSMVCAFYFKERSLEKLLTGIVKKAST